MLGLGDQALFGKKNRLSSRIPSADPHSETFTSLGLKALLESLAADRKYRILDLGPAIGTNIEFLTRYSLKIRVEDLHKSLQAAGLFGNGNGVFNESSLMAAMPFSVDEQFDVVLAWDLLNYFNAEELKVLVRYLGAACTRGGYFFAMGATAKEMPDMPTIYRILTAETLLYSTNSQDMRICPRYAPRDLALLMDGFHINSSYILRNGIREYVFVRE